MNSARSENCAQARLRPIHIPRQPERRALHRCTAPPRQPLRNEARRTGHWTPEGGRGTPTERSVVRKWAPKRYRGARTGSSPYRGIRFARAESIPLRRPPWRPGPLEHGSEACGGAKPPGNRRTRTHGGGSGNAARDGARRAPSPRCGWLARREGFEPSTLRSEERWSAGFCLFCVYPTKFGTNTCSN